jgi:hypothetical protein
MAKKKTDEKATEKTPIKPDDGIEVVEGGEALVEEFGEIQIGGGRYRDGAGRIIDGADSEFAYRTIPDDVPEQRAASICDRFKREGFSEMKGIHHDTIPGRHFRTSKKNAERISAAKLAAATQQRQSQAVPDGMALGHGKVEYGETGKE